MFFLEQFSGIKDIHIVVELRQEADEPLQDKTIGDSFLLTETPSRE